MQVPTKWAYILERAKESLPKPVPTDGVQAQGDSGVDGKGEAKGSQVGQLA